MMQLTDFKEVNEYLDSYANSYGFYNLANIRVLMDHLGHPENKYKTIHIAGTSGKTSTSYFVSSLLIASGKTVGLTVSPVVDEINERVQINLKPLDERDFVIMFNKFINLLSNLNIKPSRFELIIAFAFWYFAEIRVDYAVIEVGLGGLNDATNIIEKPNKVCLITDIGYDHVGTLGNTLTEIAKHKAGIIYARNEVFMYRQPEEVMTSIGDRVKQVGAKLNLVKVTPNSNIEIVDYQHRNWELAYAAYEYIKTRDNLPKINKDLLEHTKHLQVPARMDIKKYKGKTIILDSAHNAQKMATFIASFKKLYPDRRPSVLIAMGVHKDYQAIADQLSEISSRVIVTGFKIKSTSGPTSISTKQLSDAFKEVDHIAIDDAKEALEVLLKSNDDLLVITGSIYLISQLRREVDFLK